VIRRVLIVDDDQGLRTVLATALGDEGFVVTQASDGLAGLRLFESAGADLVILDILMPEMDGLEVCRRVRRKSAVPIVLLSSRGDEVDRVTGLETGADDYVTKPFSTRELWQPHPRGGAPGRARRGGAGPRPRRPGASARRQRAAGSVAAGPGGREVGAAQRSPSRAGGVPDPPGAGAPGGVLARGALLGARRRDAWEVGRRHVHQSLRRKIRDVAPFDEIEIVRRRLRYGLAGSRWNYSGSRLASLPLG
jgi:CheY-like chemotaxis protein